MVSKHCKGIYKISLRKTVTICAGLFFGLILCSHTAKPYDYIISPPVETGVSFDTPVSIDAETDYLLHELSDNLADSAFSAADVRAVDYAESIYNYLVGTIHSDLTTIGTRQNTTNTRLNSILACLNGNSSTNTYLYDIVVQILREGLGYKSETASGSFLSRIDKYLNYNIITANNLSISDMLWTISAYLSGNGSGYSWDTVSTTIVNSASSHAGSYTKLQSLESKLTSLLDNNVTWSDTSVTLLGTSLTLDGVYDASIKTGRDIYFKFDLGSTVVSNNARFSLPISYPINTYIDAFLYSLDGTPIDCELIGSSRVVYALGVPTYFGTGAILQIHSENNNISSVSISSRPFKIQTSATDFNSTLLLTKYTLFDINHKLSNLVNEIAFPSLEQAKQESMPVINEVLEDFTGTGSSAPTVNHVSDASDISSTLSNGLASGASTSDALTVFRPGSSLYMWFSQECKDYFTLYSPTRSNKDWSNVVWTDDVPDILTTINQDVKNQIGDDR